MEYKLFYFPEGSWNQILRPEGDGYVAMWDDADGSHIYEMPYWENGYYDPDEEIPEDAREYYSEDIYIYRD